MAAMTARKMEIGQTFLGQSNKAIRLIYWITIPPKNKDQIVVRFLEKRGDGKLLKLVSDRHEMKEDSFRSGTDRYLAEWLYDECIVESLDHCIIVPRHKIANFLSLLSKGRSFYYGDTKEKLKIFPEPAKPILKVKKESNGNVELSVKYKVFDELTDLNKNDVIVESPLWVRNGDYIFEIESHEIFLRWPMLKKGKFSLGANQAHDFLFNQVPRLKQDIQVDVDKDIKVKESSKNIKPHFRRDRAEKRHQILDLFRHF